MQYETRCGAFMDLALLKTPNVQGVDGQDRKLSGVSHGSTTGVRIADTESPAASFTNATVREHVRARFTLRKSVFHSFPIFFFLNTTNN
jgi:hypothetical protein